MRKKTVSYVASTIFWYVLYFLPVLAFLVFLFVNPLYHDSKSSEDSFGDIVSEKVLVIDTDLKLDGLTGLNLGFDNFGVFPFTLRIQTYTSSTGSGSSFVVPCFATNDSATYPLPQTNVLHINSSWYQTQPFYVTVPDSFEWGEDSNVFQCLTSGQSNAYSLPFNYSDVAILDLKNVSLVSNDSISTVDYNFESFVNKLGFEFATDNIIVNTLVDCFGENGILPLFKGREVFIVFAWYVCVVICHLVVDFLLFIPKLCHKWMKNATEDV